MGQRLIAKKSMKNKISVFKNWESLCLFDSFTTLGNGFLKTENMKSTWGNTYFRIYLFRLFFKYNLFRYNSELHENTVKLRDQFEKFLNNYYINHISFNFLPNEMYTQIGNALNLQEELDTFRERINRISSAIQEEKQSRMNMLLKAVAALSALETVQPIIEVLTVAQKNSGMTNSEFYGVLITILILLLLGVLYFLYPNLFLIKAKKISELIKKKNIT